MAYQIIDNLFLGDASSSLNMTNIDLVINCTSDLPFHAVNAKHIRIPIEDNSMYIKELFEYWLDFNLFKTIDQFLSKKKIVLIHCLAGRQRSAATIAAFLMWKTHANLEDIIIYIKNHKIDAFFPNINFLVSLKNFELKINSKISPIDIESINILTCN